MRPLSTCVRALPDSCLSELLALTRTRADAISLCIGDPDLPPPACATEAGVRATRLHPRYTPDAGLPELQEQIALSLHARYGVRYCPDREVLVTLGASEGLDLAMRTLVEPGDEVLLAEPCYPAYEALLRLAGGVPAFVPCRAAERFRLSPGRVAAAITAKSKAILLCSPGNPTGAVQSRADLQAIVDLAVTHDLYLITDEVYDRLVYEGTHVNVATLRGARERTVLLNSFSKSYAMTGWRVGSACAPEFLIRAMVAIHRHTVACAPFAAQVAATAALRDGEADVRALTADYAGRRRFLVHNLNQAGLECQLPPGGLFAFPSVRHTGLTSLEFARRLIAEEGVVVVPGSAFGPSGEGHVRCSFAVGRCELRSATERIARFVARLPVGRSARRPPRLPQAVAAAPVP